MVEINWTKQSIQDIDNIANFIAKDSEKYAVVQTLKFFESVKILEYQPEIRRIVPELGMSNVRELIEGNYRIIYRVKKLNLIDILTVHHSKRLISNNPTFKRKNS
nr:type II toxin-antitoxin system RelE/ParE family toxin [Pseudopedobacter sp.]